MHVNFFLCNASLFNYETSTTKKRERNLIILNVYTIEHEKKK